MTDTVSLTLWAKDVSRALSSPQDWLDELDTVAAESKTAGSALLVLPEYVSEQWLCFAGPDMKATAEPARMAEIGAQMHAGIQAVADRRKIDILAGTWPVSDGAGGYNNVAHLYTQGATAPFTQPKLCLTPGEKDPAGWGVKPGKSMTVFRWNDLNCAIVTCLDIELPALSVRLAKEAPDIDLIFCPSMTEMLSGYSRVFGCAKARAVELLTTVCAVGVIGTTPLKSPRPNVSGAAVFLPCEKVLGYDGTFAKVGPIDGATADDPMGPRLHAKDIPIGTIRALRRSQPEVWPGAWSAEAIDFTVETADDEADRFKRTA